MNANYIGSWIDSLQAGGKYAFLRDQAIAAAGLSREAVKKSLLRLAKRKRIAKVTDSFYVIVPTEYQNAGSPPASWFIDPLMTAMKHPYYVGLLSAASLFGASHHQPQEFQVVTNASLRPLIVGRQRIHFFNKRHMAGAFTVGIKTPTGMIRVSSPETTVLDLVRFVKSAGHLGNVAAILGELAEQLRLDALIQAAEQRGNLPAVQRLGYLLERVGAQTITVPLAAWLARRHPRAIPLRPGRPIQTAPRHATWNLFINESVEDES